MSGYTLGLDIGTNSVGWAAMWDDTRTDPPGRIKAGVRIFPEGVARTSTGREEPSGQTRREARSARRVHARRRGRKRKLRKLLQAHGLLPTDEKELARLMATDPYPLRARALDDPLTLHEVGRVLYHLCQRRGFKSNRKSSGQSDGKVAKETAALQEEIDQSGCRTLGEYLASIGRELTHGERVRNRYTLRAMYEHEFTSIWDAQQAAHPNVLTDDLCEAVHQAIFFQRPIIWNRATIGRCELEPEEVRAPRGHWVGQQFRMLQEVAHLRLVDPYGEVNPLADEQRSMLIGALGVKKELTFAKIRELLNLTDAHEFTLESGNLGKREKLYGNEIEWRFRTKLGKAYTDAPEELKNHMWDAVAETEDPDELRRIATEEWGLSDKQLDKLFPFPVPSGRFNYSVKAMRRLIPHLVAGYVLSEAKERAGYEVLPGPVEGDRLPPVADAVPNLTNPIVRRGLTEVRKVVNAVVREYGKPTAIRVELARDAKDSAQRRQERHLENLNRARENAEIEERLKTEFNLASPSRNDIVKFRLWEECAHECPYSGEPIPKHKLFTADVEIEHIIPYSRSLDDSYMNKTLCMQAENRIKHNQTPFEAYGDKPEAWEAILQRVRKLPFPKRRRFVRKHIELDDFIERQLNDTRYISRAARRYLESLGVPVMVARGDTTHELRRQWGLNDLLGPATVGPKPRSDHRHHAVDAAVVAMTGQGHLQRLAHVKFDPRRPELPPPWPSFRDDLAATVADIIVSHRPTRRLAGGLHAETRYGATERDGIYVTRKPVGDLTPAMIERIRDPAIRDIIKKECNRRGIALAGSKAVGKALADPPPTMPSGVPIKRVRVTTPASNAVAIRSENGKATAYVDPGDTHHIEIFQVGDPKGKASLTGRAVSRYEAHGRLQRGEPVINRFGQTGKTFRMSLCKNDMVMLTVDKGEKLHATVALSLSGFGVDIRFRLHASADKENASSQVRIRTWAALNRLKPRKVTVDVLGRVHPCND